MGLGNIVFGNSRGRYEIERDGDWMRVFERLLNVFSNYAETWHVPEYENEVFWIMPYWWGECTCGYDYIDNSHQEARSLKHRPECYQIEYKQKVEPLSTRLYGLQPGSKEYCEAERQAKEALLALYKKHNLEYDEKDPFRGCAVRCSCDYDERLDAVMKKYAALFGCDGHKTDCMLAKDNFHYKPTDFGIQWYKYPLRDSYMNQDISLEEFRRIIDDCIASVKTKKRKPVKVM